MGFAKRLGAARGLTPGPRKPPLKSTPERDPPQGDRRHYVAGPPLEGRSGAVFSESCGWAGNVPETHNAPGVNPGRRMGKFDQAIVNPLYSGIEATRLRIGLMLVPVSGPKQPRK